MLSLPVFHQFRGLFRDRRRSDRSETPRLLIVIDGRLHPVLDWSAGGARIASRPGRFELDQEVWGEVSGAGVSRPGRFRAEVAWLDGKDSVGLRFLELPADLQAAMERRCMSGKVAKQVVTVIGTTPRFYAAMRADRLIESGDLAGAAVWRRGDQGDPGVA